MTLRRALLVLLAGVALISAAPAAGASFESTVAIRDAIDQFGDQLAAANPGWEYVDRMHMSGDYKRFHATLSLIDHRAELTECDPPPHQRRCRHSLTDFEWEVEVLAERCGPGEYAINSPLSDEESCGVDVRDLAANWQQWKR